MASQHIRALAKGLEVLRAIGQLPEPSLRNLHAATGFPKPTVFRILETLCDCGYVVRGPEGLFTLTPSVLSLSTGFDEHDWSLRIAHPVLEDLCKRVVWPSDIGKLEDDLILVKHTTRLRSPLAIGFNCPRTSGIGGSGYRMSTVRTALGRAYLAFCSEEEREKVLRRVASFPPPDGPMAKDRPQIDKILCQARRAGYAVRCQHLNPDTTGVAVPIMAAGNVFAAINLVFFRNAISLSHFEKHFLPQLQSTADWIGDQLEARRSAGFVVPTDAADGARA